MLEGWDNGARVVALFDRAFNVGKQTRCYEVTLLYLIDRSRICYELCKVLLCSICQAFSRRPPQKLIIVLLRGKSEVMIAWIM